MESCSISTCRGAVLVALVLMLLATVPAQAAVAVDLELSPRQVKVGEPAELMLRAWTLLDNGRILPADPVGYPWSIRAYRAEEFSGYTALESYKGVPKGIPVQVSRGESSIWRGEIVFPEAGYWIIVVRNYYPPLTMRPPDLDSPWPAKLEVKVLPGQARGGAAPFFYYD